MRLFVMAAALRRDSLNKKLARLVAVSAERAGATVDLTEFGEFTMPLYDGDVEAASGIPAGARQLRERIGAADAFALVSPEYNASVPGTIKNAIDWVSRVNPSVFRGRPGLLCSASPSLIGGNRSLWALRVPLEVLGACLHPDMFSLAQAHTQFDEAGALKEAKLAARLDAVVAEFLRAAAALVAARR